MRASLILTVTIAATCVAEYMFKVDIGELKPGSGNIDTTTTRSLLGCAKRCSEHSDCKSIFFQPGVRECQRHNIRYTSPSAGFVAAPSVVYFEKEDTSTSTTSTTTTTTSTTTAATSTTTIPTTTTPIPTTSTTTIPTTTTLPTTSTTTSTTTTTTPCVPTAFSCPPSNHTTFTPVILPGCNETFSYRTFKDVPRDFFASKATCETEGGSLMKILTLEKQAFMMDLAACSGYSSTSAWISGLYNDVTSTWETIDGTPLPMSQGDFWDINRPNENPPNDNCVNVKSSASYLWDDYYCTHTFGYTLCEKP